MRVSIRPASVGLIRPSNARLTARILKRHVHTVKGRKQSANIVASSDKRGYGQIARYRAETTTEAAVEEELTIELPLECQQLLGFPQGSLPKISDVSLAFQELVDMPLMSGYSTLASEARHELLLIAKSDLVSSQQHSHAKVGQQGYRPAASIDIPLDLVPGAMVILAEIGENEKALQLGRELLSTPDLFLSASSSPSSPPSSSLLPSSAKCDIALSMALAHCSLAGLALDSPPTSGPQESQGSTVACIHLQDALHLLEDNPPNPNPYGSSASASSSLKGWGDKKGSSAPAPPLAPGLVKEIKASLMSLRAPCILQELTSTLSPNPKPNGTGSQQERRKRALRSLRELLKEDSHSTPTPGPNSFLPFSSPQPQQGAGEGARRLDPVLVKQMMSALACEELVHLVEWEQVARQGPSVHTWLYPGLLTLVAVGHLITGFSQRQPAYVKIAASLLKGARDGQGLVAGSMAQLLLGQVAPAVALIQEAQSIKGASAKSSVSWDGAGAYAFVVDHSPEGGEGEDGLLPGLCAFAEQWMIQAAFPLFPDTAISTKTPSLSGYFDDSKVEALISVYDESKSLLQSEAEAEGGRISSRAARLASDLAAAASGVQSALLAKATSVTPGGFEADGFKIPEVLYSLVPPIKRYGLAALGVLAALGAIGASSSPTVPAQTKQQTNAAASVASRSHPSVEVAVMDRDSAQKLIKSWQNVKQSCLGPDHDVATLSSILTGQALSEAKQRAVGLRDKGYAMKYRLYKCEIKEIASSKNGPLTLRALLDESASIIGKDGKATADYHRSSYEATYQVVNVAKGGQAEQWRISKIVVSKSDNEH